MTLLDASLLYLLPKSLHPHKVHALHSHIDTESSSWRAVEYSRLFSLGGGPRVNEAEDPVISPTHQGEVRDFKRKSTFLPTQIAHGRPCSPIVTRSYLCGILAGNCAGNRDTTINQIYPVEPKALATAADCSLPGRALRLGVQPIW
jgi:hypothetical protein